MVLNTAKIRQASHWGSIRPEWFFVAAVLVGACDEVDTTGAGGTTTGGVTVAAGAGDAGLDARQACMDLCESEIQCWIPADIDCAAYCDGEIFDGQSACDEELAAHFNCRMEVAKMHPGECVPGCVPLQNELDYCLYYNGCFIPNVTCMFPETVDAGGPSPEEVCACVKVCQQVEYVTKCSTDGITTSCKCLIQGVLVGTCEPGASDFCNQDVERTCCRTLFGW
jgi:hypothetical protein